MSVRGRVLACLIILLGLVLRLDGLDSKAYGNDEATTSLRVSGATIANFYALFDGKPRTVAQLKSYQEIRPGSSIESVNRSLAAEDPQHPPFYYDLERLWVAHDQGVAGHRRLSVLFGTLLIPAAGWLIFELANSAFASLVVMALFAVSPFFVLYSQQAREYSLWGLFTALASAALVRQLRTKSKNPAAWAGYGALCLCGLMTDILFVGVMVAHAAVLGLYFRQHPQSRGPAWRALAMLILSGAAGAALWLPALLGNSSAVTNNAFLAQSLPLKVFAAKWLVNISTTVVDFGLLPAGYGAHALVLLGLALAGLSLAGIAAAAVWAARRLRGEPLVFLAALIAIPALMLIVPDLLKHESRSTAARYVVPSWIGIELLLAMSVSALRRKSRAAAVAVLAVILASGVVSALARRPVPAWWTDWSAYGAVAQANGIESLKFQPADISYVGEGSGWDFSVMELVNRLPQATMFRMYRTTADFLRDHPEHTALLDPSSAVLSRLQAAGLRLQALPLGATQLGPAVLGRKNTAGDAAISLWTIAREK